MRLLRKRFTVLIGTQHIEFVEEEVQGCKTKFHEFYGLIVSIQLYRFDSENNNNSTKFTERQERCSEVCLEIMIQENQLVKLAIN